MNILLDQTDSSGAHRLLVTSVIERGSMVKTASETPAVVDNPETTKFADTAHRLWPLSDRDAIVESAASIELQRGLMPPARYLRVTREVNKAASVHECLVDVGRARSQAGTEIFSTTVKKAGEQYALPEIHNFPIDTADHTRLSVAFFCDNRGSFPYPWREKAAKALIKAAKAHGVGLTIDQGSTLDASAGNGFGPVGPIARQLAGRASKIAHRNPELAGKLYANAVILAQSDTSNPAATITTMKNACRVMDEIDDLYDLRVDYGRELTFPEDVAFATTVTKIAAADRAFIEVGRGVYRRDEVSAIDPSGFAILGPDFVESISTEGSLDAVKFASAVKTADAGVLQRVMTGFGVHQVDVSSDNQASVVPSSEINRWAGIAGDFGTDLIQDMDGGFKFRFQDPASLTIGEDQPVLQNAGFLARDDTHELIGG